MIKQFFEHLSFYSQILPSFSNIGYSCRRLFWKTQHYDHSGQTWLVTGASGGIGRAVVEGALKNGASVIVVARSEHKLRALQQELSSEWADKIDIRVVDLSLQSEISRLLEQLVAESINIDVLVNNVGVLLDDMTITSEGVETSFATNLLNHFQLTQTMIGKSVLSDQATIVNVVSGGMYAVPLVIENLDIQSDQYDGLTAYAYHKRAQVVLTQYWREQESSNRQFYAMHPGWVDTDGVKTSLPTFRKILRLILRDSVAGADTILWLIGERPKQSSDDLVWLDRKPRKSHYLQSSMHGNNSADQLVSYLQSRLI